MRLAAGVLALCIVATAATGAPRVQLASGMLEGTASEDGAVQVYRGVPYARPPLGDLRWKAPEPPEPWDGLREAKSFSPLCPQEPYPAGNFWEWLQPPAPTSEDCLYLNIWAPAGGDARPVIVWIHGGGLVRGAGSLTAYDGEALARRGVVLVTINYRLGLLGFFAHPALTAEAPYHASGNYGLLDQRAALQWVRDNIGAFGGDPRRVTIMGESAGAKSVNMLMASPLTAGLFQGVIGQSGAGFGPMPSLAALKREGAAAGGDIEALRALPYAELRARVDEAAFGPNVDGYLFRESVYQTFAGGRQHAVPVLVGWNADEIRTLQRWPEKGDAEFFRRAVRSTMGAFAEEMLAAIPVRSDAEARDAYFAFYRDLRFGWPAKAWARLQARRGARAYLYHFTRVPAGPAGQTYGAFHAAEIPYVFNTQHLVLSGWDETDRSLADTMARYWVNFATTGDPNGAGLASWPAYDEAEDAALELGDGITVRSRINEPVMRIIDRYVPTLAPVTD